MVYFLTHAGIAHPNDGALSEARLEAAGEVSDAIVVTGSRVARTDGMETPFPVVIVESAEIEALSLGSLVTGISQLPQFYGNELQAGYDEFWGNRGGAIDYFDHGSSSAHEADLRDGDVRIDEVGYYTDILAERSLAFLDERAAQPDKPWLLSLHFTAPHWP